MAYHEDVDRYEDILLDYHDIQLLSSLEGVIAFFGKLRYNIDDHLAQTTAAMDFTSEQMRTAIKHIERIASHTDFDSFSIYLFELSRMTVALRTEIVKNFRNRPGNYLLVLTDDYERLDFVLVERYTQTITTQTDWAIVTNGIIWRLYAAKAHSRATNYYEVNLQETLALDPSKREEAFRYFWLFFRAAAFIPTERIIAGEKRAANLLDELLIQSDLQARELGERLKNRVFEEIFPYFALGFVHHARQHDLLPPHLDSLSTEERNRLLEPYFMGTLTFLYRLLFLFYAESRDLLPVRQERGYYEHSLERLKQEIAKNAGDLQDRVASKLTVYSESSTAIYDNLVVLFAAIDKGNPALNVPIYNGGLFMTNPPPSTPNEPPEITVARFLQEHKITDRQLALGLDRMARDVDEKLSKTRLAFGEANDHSHALIFIDYKSLGVRHLGSIYEGLLEFKLCIAPEEMAVVEGKRTEEIIPYTEAKLKDRRILKVRQGKDLKERLYARGAVYLENDRRERKATGSYYTPDYIVQYIAEQTVGPILKDKLEKLRGAFRAAQEHLHNEQNKVRALRRTDIVPEHETYKAYRVSLNEAFFDLKVLDPAMGSGHFLVEVVDYITDQMAKFLNAFRWNPVIYELALTRKKIEDGMKEQGVTDWVLLR